MTKVTADGVSDPSATVKVKRLRATRTPPDGTETANSLDAATVAVPEGVAVGVFVAVAVAVAVGEGVLVGVLEGVPVGVLVGVFVGVPEPVTTSTRLF